ncbi:uncharacterized protein SPAPADRAFT_61145 [Spathaspora passalidarum NRRL Y-27907]|uniref:Uncharacterized protein n=1 Tax=Spathaspora passalidarum (strain NRRL Y-27907 / 11-Y1) TaxID=619300 RepID=G3AP20_SPAPN|nr:uncharacterized protein SPAPADRAFT_61145 [Spathaspora passalidarum NRRL Y-27907]EGW32051.1 hypothetical protein SPAPADRAFT_61145 [Spathaspora passalidarum NRRL Y-27907]
MRFIRLYNISHHPLNYHTYLSRIKKLPKVYHESTTPIKQQLLLDLVKANRTLQRTNTSPNYAPTRLNLELSTPTNAKLESGLKKLLFHDFRRDALDDVQVVKEYLLTEPKPSNVQDLIEITSDSFRNQLTHKKDVDTSIVYITLSRILDQNDYFNGFNLIDKTVNSDLYLDYRKSRLMKLVVSATLANIGVLALQSTLLPDIPLLAWMLLNISSTALVSSMANLKISNLGRIKFRFYNSQLYNYLHKHELITTNKIITHLEEFNETNLINFHYSKVRPEPNLKTFTVDNYIVELPDAVVETNAHPWTHLPNEEISNIQKFFKSELNKRRMVLCDLNSELLFLEYWKNHGEGFAWVEPDQDPGEIIKLKIKQM